jgi:rhamnose transport system substrate-binding protein
MVMAMFACAQTTTPAATETATEAATEPAAETAAEAPAAAASYAIIAKSAPAILTWREWRPALKKSSRRAGAEAIVKYPAEITAEAQITLINELVAQGVSGIAVAANDADALETALTAAMDKGIKVVSLDSSVNPASRMTHINQAGVQQVAQCLVDAVYDLTGGSGDWAILSATSTATNQNAWIDAMKGILKDSKYAEMNLVEVAYGDDQFQKSVDQTQALIANYPDLKVICAPTTVGIAAASKVVTDNGLQGKLIITGLASLRRWRSSWVKAPLPARTCSTGTRSMLARLPLTR